MANPDKTDAVTDAELRGLLAEALPYVQSRHVHMVAITADTHQPINCEQCALEARITAALAEKDGGWIAVSERLPEVEVLHIDGEDEECDFSPVLFVADRTVCAGRFWPAFSRKEKNVFISLQGCVYKSSQVTHWQPLPPLPKGE